MTTVPARAADSAPPSAYDPEAGAGLAEMLTRLTLAFPRQRLSEAEHEERVMLYVEALAPRWPLAVIAEALHHGLREWRWFPTVAEIEAECSAARARRYAIANPAPVPRRQIEDTRAPAQRTDPEVVAGMSALVSSLRAKVATVPRSGPIEPTREPGDEDTKADALRRVRAATAGRALIPMPWHERAAQTEREDDAATE